MGFKNPFLDVNGVLRIVITNGKPAQLCRRCADAVQPWILGMVFKISEKIGV
nr:hypothetical protein Itr_chr04CG23940 [Ipomoea trifida]